VLVGVFVGVLVGVFVGVLVAVSVGVAVGAVEVLVGVEVGVAEVLVGVAVGTVEVFVGVAVGPVDVAVAVAIGRVPVGVIVGAAPPGPATTAMYRVLGADGAAGWEGPAVAAGCIGITKMRAVRRIAKWIAAHRITGAPQYGRLYAGIPATHDICRS
jgi:hypothetical protein